MQIGKKVALMAAAAAGTMVVGGAGSASASGLFPHTGGATQLNSCGLDQGAIAQVGGAAPTRDITTGADCVNFTNGGAAFQANDCDTTTGAIAQMGGASPSGDINVGADCTNIALDEPDQVVVVHKDPPKKQHKAKEPHKAKKHHKAKCSHKVTKHHKAKVKAEKKDCKH
ncbi:MULTISPECIES: hypothetical protein [Streptomyces violaceusniger group]|uniref:Chaplin domain-containing protein n=2 Tax=Streptomyces violaceusniger group TaxID=2839105 RepID=A0ABD5JFM3_9ACTN|nr:MULTISPECIES: hypothetical protein [Streptomyces]KUL46851.1 hypothetical protein ADL28_33825 [Streptomyces violaceusniger]MEE4586870.1 hypothetical protein [Streptomyces sp. DSM 41602]WJD98180.1 hypothetical protein QR300_20505 [Streptomyces antimycoticus]